MYPARVEGAMVILRELAEADTAALHKVYGSDDATRHLSFEPRSMEQVAGIISAVTRSATADPRTEYMLAVAGKDEELIGAARLATGEYESATIGLRSALTSGVRAKGWKPSASFSGSASPDSACTGSGGARSPFNEASARTMRAAGMTEEGTIRGHLFTRGAWRDSVVHSILREEFDG